MQSDRRNGLVRRERLTRRQAIRRAGLVTAAAALAPVLQACSRHTKEDHKPEVGAPVAEVAPTPTQAPAGAAPTEPANAGPTAAPQATGGRVVEMNDQLRFVPDRLTIKVGETVTWRTVGAAPHTSTGDPAKALNPQQSVKLPDGAATWDSGLVTQGQEFSHTFAVAGEYTYFCIPHEAAGMVASLTVTP